MDKLSQEELLKRAFRIKPVVARNGEGDVYFIKPVDIRKAAYLWDPRYEERVETHIYPMDLYIEMKFLASSPSLFKPSVEEVLSQIPAEDVAKGIVAFRILDGGGGWETVNGKNYHIADVKFYGGGLPDEIRDQVVIFEGKKYTAPQRAKKEPEEPVQVKKSALTPPKFPFKFRK